MSDDREKGKDQDGGEAAEGEWGELIHGYSRREAIRDGVLVDVTHVAVESGFVFPVAITSTLYHGYITPDSTAVQRGESTTGRLHDLFTILRAHVAGAKPDTDMIFFETIFTKAGNPRRVKMKALVGPGDNAEAVITIMLPEED